MDLATTNALVTGAGTRLGQAIARALAAAGAGVAVQHWRSEAGASDLVAEVTAGGGRAVALRADLTDPSACERVVREGAAALGPLDVLVNSAAVFLPGTLVTTGLDEWEAQFALNLRAPFLLTRAFVAQLPATRHGKVVNVTDARLRRPAPGHLAYRLTKAALAHMTEVLAVELAPRVSVNAVAPGAMLPPPGEGAAAFGERVARAVPLQRAGGATPVADAVLYLLREDFVTGVVLPVDGGEYL
jgi:NAD(P)-dependent dehydrogenase (short-subunit alcohol dehydrogenase family)